MTTQANQNIKSKDSARKSSNAMGERDQEKPKTLLTNAQKKIEEYRDSINPGAKKITGENNCCVVYLYEHKGYLCAAGYRGRAKKQSFRYRYSSEEKRSDNINGWIEKIEKNRKINTKTQKHTRTLNVNDVLVSSWGYEQTNVSYYLVVKLVGALSVSVVEIGSQKTFDGCMSGTCTPNLADIKSEPVTKRETEYGIKIDYRYARKLNKTIKSGLETFETNYWSSYA